MRRIGAPGRQDRDGPGGRLAAIPGYDNYEASSLGNIRAKTFGRIGGGRPFDDRSTDFLDLLSAADIAAGSVGQYFTGRDAVGEENVCVKLGAEKVLERLGSMRWRSRRRAS